MKKIDNNTIKTGATAADVMDTHPSKVNRADKISAGIDLIMDNRYRHLPVVDEQERYLGIFGVNCMLRLALPQVAVMEKGLNNVSFIYETLSEMYERVATHMEEPVESCMRTDVATVYPDTPLVETLMHLYTDRTSIPVVEHETGRLLGMISYFDVGRHVLDAAKN